ncbi:MAG: hypothetical protein CMJ83_03135, partial [Planctomycetes bacterium]|nr:hypothetical protein [Planctomycetota bacterium]
GDDVVEKVWFPGEPTPPTPTPTSTGEGPSDGPDSPPALTKGAGATPPAAGTYLGAGPPQQPVPEPETVFLFLIGSLAIVALLWRRGYLTLPNGARDLAHR